MPGFLLDAAATVLCPHGGRAQPTAPVARVLLGGSPAVSATAPHVITGCTLPPPAGGPCVTAQWVTGAVRVLSAGAPLLLADSLALCSPPSLPATVAATQTRVRGA
jgi:hypothetical protein